MNRQPQPLLRYEQTSEYRWTVAAFEFLESGRLTARLLTADDVTSAVVEGNCPRCAHHITDRRPLTAVTSVLNGNRNGGKRTDNDTGQRINPSASADPVVLDITCSCGVPHPGAFPVDAQAPGAGGCGVSFRIELVLDQPSAGGQA